MGGRFILCLKDKQKNKTRTKLTRKRNYNRKHIFSAATTSGAASKPTTTIGNRNFEQKDQRNLIQDQENLSQPKILEGSSGQ